MALCKELHFEALLHKEKTGIHILMLKCTSKWKPIQLSLEGGAVSCLFATGVEVYQYQKLYDFKTHYTVNKLINFWSESCSRRKIQWETEAERQGIETLNKWGRGEV